jgi:hypothetical protein
MTDLVEFLRAALDEDERVARAADVGSDVFDGTGIVVMPNRSTGDRTITLPSHIAAHIAHHDPARVLAEVAAKRAILELHDGEHDCRELMTGVYPHDWPSAAPWGSAGEAWRHASSEHFEGPCPTLRLLAQPYAGRPGWREEWAT